MPRSKAAVHFQVVGNTSAPSLAVKFEMNETKVKNVKMMRQNEADNIKIGSDFFFVLFLVVVC